MYRERKYVLFPLVLSGYRLTSFTDRVVLMSDLAVILFGVRVIFSIDELDFYHIVVVLSVWSKTICFLTVTGVAVTDMHVLCCYSSDLESTHVTLADQLTLADHVALAQVALTHVALAGCDVALANSVAPTRIASFRTVSLLLG